jgi:DNA-binding MarR family transcriptional regulator/predicted N-acetyltransferase YhbS
MAGSGPAGAVEAVRRFNRYYTRRIGVLEEGWLGSDLTLAETRVLWELGHAPGTTASVLAHDLGLDAGYLSRILRGFRARGYVEAQPASGDGRVRHLTLTARGRRRLAPLEARSSAQVRAMLAPLAAPRRSQLLDAMAAVQSLLGPDTPAAAGKPEAGVVLRAPRAGDFGWVVERHGAIYAREQGWDERFEGLVAKIVGDFLAARPDPVRERAWIAERGGERVGCVFLVRRSRASAQLRLLLVEPSARGHGVGSALVDACIDLARSAGYSNIVLWTQSVLHAARAIYAAKGFRRVASEKHAEFGTPLTGETWKLDLAPVKAPAR